MGFDKALLHLRVLHWQEFEEDAITVHEGIGKNRCYTERRPNLPSPTIQLLDALRSAQPYFIFQ